MNIKKQYIRPYCNLLLEGFDENAAIAEDELNSQEAYISILTNAECHFATSNQKISGGRVFLENLASAVSSYTQELLSGLSHPQDNQKEYPQVQITPIDSTSNHRLILEQNPQEDQAKQEITLRTLELFDLIEVIDQFYTDNRTLSDVSLQLEVMSKRFRQPDEPLVQRIIPLVTGTASLAVAAGLFFMLPIPESRQPKPTLETFPTQTLPDVPEATPTPSSEPNSSQPETNNTNNQE